MELEILLKLWPIVMVLILSLIWNIRLEAKVLYLEKDHAREIKSSSEKDKLMWEKFDAVVTELTNVKMVLTKLQTTIEIKTQVHD